MFVRLEPVPGILACNSQLPLSTSCWLFHRRTIIRAKMTTKKQEKKFSKEVKTWGWWLERQIGQTLHRILQRRKWVWTLNNALHIWACSSCLNAAEVPLRSNVSGVKTKNKDSQCWVDPLFFLTLSILPSYLITAPVQNTLIPHVLHSWEGVFAKLHFPFSNTDN